MQFALLIYQPWKMLEEGLPALSETEVAAIANEYGELAATPGLKSNTPLGYRKDATTVRVEDGTTIVSDGTVGGPDATAGSVYIFEAEDKEAAIEFAAKIPAARMGGAVEVRPVGMYW
jgi:hypothetical protein